MGVFEQFPYTNFHDLNLDWIVKKVKTMSDTLESFILEVEQDIKDEVDSWLDAHPEATTTVLDGAITEAKLDPDMVDATRSWINIKSVCPGYVLDNSTIAQAITDALAISRYIYIPAGNYTFNAEISADCHIILDKDCYISTDNDTPAIYAHDCSIILEGGHVYAGLNDDSRVPVYWSDTQSIHKGIIYLENCHDSVVKNMSCDHSKYSAVFRIVGCENVTFENLNFDNILLSAITIHNYNRNVVVRNCSFTHLKKITGHDYCYAVATGVTDFSDNSIIPPDGLIYENNYVNGSEDCGLDTHGAKNVIIRNNKVLQTVCAITAYNDNGRALRPSGWHMENITIENNFCQSDKNNEVGRQFPHPFIFLGGDNSHTNDDVGYELNPGSYYDYCDCIVRNNYFESPNTYANGTITLGAVSRNVIIENNVVDCRNANRPFQPVNSINLIIRSNTFKNVSVNVQFLNCSGRFENNVGGKNYASSSTSGKWSCMEGLIQNGIQTGRSPLLRMGQVYEDSGALKVATSYGIRLRPDIALPAAVTITVTDGVATLANHGLIPYQGIKLTDGGGTAVNRYVNDVIDFKHFSIVNASNAPQADGTYTMELQAATATTL